MENWLYERDCVSSLAKSLILMQGMVDEDLDVKQFCNRYVEVMGTECDHVHIVALSDALQVILRLFPQKWHPSLMPPSKLQE